MTDASITVVHDGEGLRALAPAWRKLEGPTSSPMQQFIWSQACAAALVPQDTLRVAVLASGREPVAIAPLVRRAGSAYLELLGVRELHEPMDWTCAAPDALQPLLRGLVEAGTPLHLRRLPAHSPVVRAAQLAFRGRGVLLCTPDSAWPSLPIEARATAPEHYLNAGRRSDLRRARRLAERTGPLTVEITTPTPETLEPLLAEAFAIESAGWKGERGSALSLDPQRGAFYRHYAAAACQQGLLRICLLRIAGLGAAMELAVETANRLWLLKIGYAQRFARCSPGTLLFAEVLRYAAARRLESVELLGTIEPWCRVWSCQERPCVALRGYPLGASGATTLVGGLARAAWQRLATGKDASGD